MWAQLGLLVDFGEFYVSVLAVDAVALSHSALAYELTATLGKDKKENS